MKRKLFRLLIAGFGFVFAIWGALPVQGEGGQTPTPHNVSGVIQFEGPNPVPICYPGDQKCR